MNFGGKMLASSYAEKLQWVNGINVHAKANKSYEGCLERAGGKNDWIATYPVWKHAR